MQDPAGGAAAAAAAASKLQTPAASPHISQHPTLRPSSAPQAVPLRAEHCFQNPCMHHPPPPFPLLLMLTTRPLGLHSSLPSLVFVLGFSAAAAPRRAKNRNQLVRSEVKAVSGGASTPRFQHHVSVPGKQILCRRRHRRRSASGWGAGDAVFEALFCRRPSSRRMDAWMHGAALRHVVPGPGSRMPTVVVMLPRYVPTESRPRGSSRLRGCISSSHQ